MGRVVKRSRERSILVRASRPVIILVFLQLAIENIVSQEVVETEFCQQYVRSKGYLCEEHKMYTDDGFALLLHRVGVVQQSSASERDGGSGLEERPSNFTLGLSVKRKDESEFVPVVKLAGSKQSLSTFMDDFFIERQRPYQLDREEPDLDSNSEGRNPLRAVSLNWLGGNGHDSPQNRPVDLPSFTVDDRTIDQSKNTPPVPFPDPDSSIPISPPSGGPDHKEHAHSAPAEMTPGPQRILTPVPSPISTSRYSPASYVPTSEQLPNPASAPALWPVAPSSDLPVQTTVVDTGGSSPSPVDQISTSLSPNLTPDYSEQSRSPDVPQVFTPVVAPSTTMERVEQPSAVVRSVRSPVNAPVPVSQFQRGSPGPTPGISAQSSNPGFPKIFTPVVTPSSTIEWVGQPSAVVSSVQPLVNTPISQFQGGSPGPTFGVPESPTYRYSIPPTFDKPEYIPTFPLLSPPTPAQVPSSTAAVAPSQIFAPANRNLVGTGQAQLQGSQGARGKGEPVLLMHPELLNGDSWFKDVGEHGNNPFLPFILADAGFDVWIGHERATYWAHDHLHLESSNQEYWNWTWDEHAQHDMPMMLGYISGQVQNKIHLVGVSQSATVGAAAATRSDVALLMKSLILIGPTIYGGSVAFPLLKIWAGLFARITEEPDFSPESGPAQFNISRFAMHPMPLGGPASVISGQDCCINSLVTLFDNGWDGTTSFKNLQHFEQGILKDTFQHFDYGSPARNLEAYGQTSPPSYSPRDIPVDLPVLVIYGGQDYFSPPEGIRELLAAMQKAPATEYLPLYAHFDLFFSSMRKEDVYDPICSFLQGTL